MTPHPLLQPFVLREPGRLRIAFPVLRADGSHDLLERPIDTRQALRIVSDLTAALAAGIGQELVPNVASDGQQPVDK